MVSKLTMIGWITLASSAFVSLAVAQTVSPTAPQITGKPGTVVYPFVAEVTGNDVYIRSGRGPGYYHCGKVNAGSRVTVVEEVSGWAKIVPLAENYSWISRSYVRLDRQNPGIGTVTGDNVRVWAGSDYIEPIRSFSIQTRLNTGEVVELFDPAQTDTGDYYKIKSPSGAFLWINSEYLRYVGPLKPVEPAKEPDPVIEEPLTLEERLGVDPEPVTAPAKEEAKPAAPEKEEIAEKEVKPEPTDKETLYLQRCYDLSDKINEELKKPINAQAYGAYKEQLTEILDDPVAGRSAAYARFLLDRIERFELAIGVTDTLRQQDRRLEQIRAQIDQAHQARVQRIAEPQEQPLFSGTIRPSFVYTGAAGQKRYLLTDSEGRIQCYMQPAGPEIGSRLEQLIGSEIGIRGDIVSDPQSLVTLVSVTSIQTNE